MADIAPVAVLVAVGSTEVAEIRSKGAPTFKPVIAGFILGIGLYALEAVNADLGRMFGILVIVGSLLINGAEFFGAATNATTKGKMT